MDKSFLLMNSDFHEILNEPSQFRIPIRFQNSDEIQKGSTNLPYPTRISVSLEYIEPGHNFILSTREENNVTSARLAGWNEMEPSSLISL